MTRHRIGVPVVAALLVVVFLAPARVASAGQRPRTVGPGLVATGSPSQQPSQRIVVAGSQNAEQTRDQLDALLEKCPPSVGRILKLDPTLISTQGYLSAYPELAAFMVGHPEVARDPRYFLANVSFAADSRPPDPREQMLSFWRNMVDGSAMFLFFLVIVSAIIWLVRVLIEHRRWLRSSKMQMEMHTKLFDRFSNNEELLTYVQSPAGRRFLESSAVGLESAPHDVAMPVRRILWAVQIGLVLAAGGIGLLFISGRVIEEVQQPLFGLGAVVVSLGIGFVVSAIASYVLARRMGVLADRRAAPAA